jgi:hypothetical protein
VTAPRPAPDTELTERLAQVLAARLGWHGVVRGEPARDVAAALLPVVQQYADERAAEALEAAADDEERRVTGFAGWLLSFPIRRLRARAAALRTDTDVRAALGGETP